MSNMIMTVRPLFGTTIDVAAKEAIFIAGQLSCLVEFNLDSIRHVVNASTNYEDIVDEHESQVDIIKNRRGVLLVDPGR